MIITKWNGRPITKPGFYSGVPIEKYHGPGMCAGPSVSSSDLRTCWSKSPAHMHARWAENPKREERKVTDAMLVGAVAHHLLLGEDGFKLKYVQFPLIYHDKVTAEEKKWHNGADYCKRWAKEQAAKGRTPVKAEDLQTILAISRSLATNSLVQQKILSGRIECSGFIKDRETGLWIKVRPDVIPTASGDFADLKTAADVTSIAVMSSIRTYGYHQQGGLIWEVCEALGVPFETFTLMFAETVNPFCARAVPLTRDDLARGRLQNRVMIRQIAGCINQDRWPGPGDDDVRELPLANDERIRIDERLKREGI
jgi:hypothetical protein